MSKSLADRAANMKPMSAEVVAALDKAAYHGDGYWEEVEGLCVSHESLRAQLHREREATAAMLAKIEEWLTELDSEGTMMRAIYGDRIEKLRAILEGKA